MTGPRVWLSRLIGTVSGRSRAESDLAEEVQAHLDLLADDFVARGMSPEEARFAARRAFGGVDQVKALHRDQRGLPALSALAQDLSFACRLAVREPWFTTAAAVGLGLAIAVATTVFTIVNGMDLRTLPFDEPWQVVGVRRIDASDRARGTPYHLYRAWHEHAAGFAGLAASLNASMNVGDGWRVPERYAGTYVTANSFSVLRIQPVLGRDFTATDDQPGAAPTVLISHDVWTSRYDQDPAIVGQTIRINTVAATVIGVMPRGFRFPFQSDLWQPMDGMPFKERMSPGGPEVSVFGRLRPDTTADQAAASLASVTRASGVPEGTPRVSREVVMPFNELFFGNEGQRTGPALLGVAAVLVMLVSCVNVAALLLARAAFRVHEVAMRAALGAGRARLLTQLLIEGLVLSAPAGLIGLGLSMAAVSAFARETADVGVPYWVRFAFDGRVFAFVAGICLLSPLLFGLAPALHLSRAAMGATVREAGRGLVGIPARRGTAALVAAELAMTTMLLGAAAVLVRGTFSLYRADQVVDLDGLWTLRVELPEQAYPTEEARRRFFAQLESRFERVPGLGGAALATAVPFASTAERMVALDADDRPTDQWPSVPAVAVGSSYFATLGVGLRNGRMFADSDGPGHRFAVVNQRFVERYSADVEPIGRRLRLLDPRTPQIAPQELTIIGVAPSIRQRPMSDVLPVVYVPFLAQPAASAAAILARSATDGPDFISALRAEVQSLDRDLPLYGLQSLERISQFSRWEARVVGALAAAFAVIAALLSVLGLYAVTAYAVAQRTQEVGIRMALGAGRRQVVGLFVRSAALRLALGVGVGVVGASVIVGLLRGIVVRAGETDYLLLAATAVLFAMVALIATIVPARRAARLDSMTALRHE